MTRVARIAGGVGFAVAALATGVIALALLSIRSPLADGTFAPGPEPIAYAVAGVAVLVGSAVFGVMVMAAVELGIRVWRWRRSS